MKQTYLNKTPASRTLTILFGGWGSGPELFADCHPKDSDLMLCYDYHDLDFDTSILKGYSSIRIVAWSMGVWAASRLFSEGTFKGANIASATAFGGTAELSDDLFGIPSAIFAATVAAMSPPSLKKFRRRMCGPNLAHFEAHIPERSFEDIDGELKAVAAALVRKSGAHTALGHGSGMAQEGVSSIEESDVNQSGYAVGKPFWTEAYAGNGDLIYPPANQLRSWKRLGVPCREVDAPHYSPKVFEKLTGGQSLD